MIFEYSVQTTYEQAIDIVDIGNTCIQCTNDDFTSWFLITKTIMGKTSLLTIGPVCPDIPMLINGLSIAYSNFDYKEKTIMSSITKFINDYRKEITEVKEVLESEAWALFPDFQKLFGA